MTRLSRRQILSLNLKAARESAGMSLPDAANGAGISRQQLIRLENANHKISAETLFQLATLYKWSVVDLFNGFNDDPLPIIFKADHLPNWRKVRNIIAWLGSAKEGKITIINDLIDILEEEPPHD